MKVYTTAAEILQASLDDIRLGRWTCSTLAKSKLGEGEDERNYDGCYIPRDEPMGCALGLIATHGGHGYTRMIVFGSIEYEAFVPAYPSETKCHRQHSHDFVTVGAASEAVIQARDALFASIPARWRTGRTGSDADVYHWNDNNIANAQEAAYWFETALALVNSA